MHNFRISEKPRRTCKKKYANYSSYKKYLREDFNARCGYCDIWDRWFGGVGCYHIDHFAPKSKFEELKSEYSNLVYSCQYCNQAKKNDWVTDDPKISHNGKTGYIDPCDTAYDKLFCRSDTGEIKPLTPIGEYMYRKLKFNRARHRVIWHLSLLYQQRKRIRSLMDNSEIKQEYREELEKYYSKLTSYFDEYLDQHLEECE